MLYLPKLYLIRSRGAIYHGLSAQGGVYLRFHAATYLSIACQVSQEDSRYHGRDYSERQERRRSIGMSATFQYVGRATGNMPTVFGAIPQRETLRQFCPVARTGRTAPFNSLLVPTKYGVWKFLEFVLSLRTVHLRR